MKTSRNPKQGKNRKTKKPLENQGYDVSFRLVALAGIASLVGDEGLQTNRTDQQKSRIENRQNSLGSTVGQMVGQLPTGALESDIRMLLTKFADVSPSKVESIVIETIAIVSKAAGFASESLPPTNRLRSHLSQSNA